MNTRRGRTPSARDLDRFAKRITRVLADIDYFLRKPLGWREGAVVVWAGMRGAVTVAAAQSLPDDTPQRSVLVLIAFAVAALSLLLQGGTIGPLLRLITPKVDPAVISEQAASERTRIFELLASSAESVMEPPPLDRDPTPETFELTKKHRLAVLEAQRSALLDARDNGTFDADVLASILANLDASQIDLEMRGRPLG
jgi:CPA1 family monovalent cation:H+ antiporter